MIIKQKQIIVTLGIIISIIIISIRMIPSSYAQENGKSKTFDSQFEILEFSEKSETFLNQKSIDLEIPSLKWNISNIELNFTNIEIDKQTIEIETEDSGSKNLNKEKPGYAVQINITEPTYLSAVDIFGYLGKPSTTTNLTVQINGYETGMNRPNNTVYASTLINISSDIRWYKQTFSNPVYLSPRNYYLVINGTAMQGTTDSGKYYWYFNNINPNHPELYSSEYVTDWKVGVQGAPFLYKLNKESGIKVNPEDINMTAEVFNETYFISNSATLGTGNLSISNLNYSPDIEQYSITIQNNQSLDLIFNVSYFVGLDNLLISQGEVSIEETKENVWHVFPVFTPEADNYQVEFHYPKSWYNNITIRRGTVDVTSYITIDSNKKTIFIPNSIITVGVDWIITANSPCINIDLFVPETNFKAGEELKFSLSEPVIPGNYTFILYDSLNLEIIEENIVVPSDPPIFKYNISSKPKVGNYAAFVYFFNGTDVGIKYQEFLISIHREDNIFELILIVIIILMSGFIVTIISYAGIKKFKIQQDEKKQKLYKSCMDVLNLDYIMVSDKKSGLSVYSQNFSAKTIDGTLISGFLQALHSFGLELIKVEDQSQTIKLEYKDSIVLMSEFVNVRLILIMKENPSRFFLYSIEELTYDIYKSYGALIDSFNGDVAPFRSIEILLKKHLDLSFVYPLKIAQTEYLEKTRITQNERVYINKANSLMKTKNMNHFYMKSILPEKECNPKDVESVHKLIEKKIFQLV
ncbi:MAG: hypothetical protein ACFFG0_08730 [Candidatus Thorarchaeota archaeon]